MNLTLVLLGMAVVAVPIHTEELVAARSRSLDDVA